MPASPTNIWSSTEQQLVREVFGEVGRHARTALGVAQLPLSASVEVDMILKIKRE
jgi:enamine deaminase RidA (YjgF/YER057c/UK114 family)